MIKKNNSLKNIKIKSIYVKWIAMFTGITILAHIITMSFGIYFIIPKVMKSLSEKLERKAEFILELDDLGIEVNEELLKKVGDNDIHFYIVENGEFTEEVKKYEHLITVNMMSRVARGEIVSSFLDIKGQKLPFSLVNVDGKMALLTTNIFSNEMSSFTFGMKQYVFFVAVIDSIFIVIALLIIIKPIKKVTEATREVAKGNFNVELKSESIDEIGQLIDNFNVMTLELKKNEYLKKDFVSNVSHEFQTPITSIAGFARLLQSREFSNEELFDYTEIIIKETGRLSNLSSNLLKLSLLDSTSFDPTKSEYLLDEQIRNVILLLESKWEEKNIDLIINLNETTFIGNEELLSQVWINLIQNAIKFSNVSGLIEISLERTGEYIVAKIADQGIGVPEASKEKIFDRFYKMDSSRTTQGSGLGLSIVKRIVDISEGEIEVLDNYPCGTVFVVRFFVGAD